MRPPASVTAILRDLLAELAERVEVRVLVWAGAPLPLFRPSRGTVRRMRERLCAGTQIRCALDAKERPMHCHHEKTIVVDDRVAFVGGIDLTSEAGDRFDSSGHRARGQVGWHDASARVGGPAVADFAEHFRMRWRCARAPKGGASGLAESLIDLARREEHGSVELDKLELVEALARLIVGELQEAQGDRDRIFAITERRPIVRFVFDRVIPMLNRPRPAGLAV